MTAFQFLKDAVNGTKKAAVLRSPASSRSKIADLCCSARDGSEIKSSVKGS